MTKPTMAEDTRNLLKAEGLTAAAVHKTAPSTYRLSTGLSDADVRKARNLKAKLVRLLKKSHPKWTAELYVTTHCTIQLRKGR